MGVLTRRKYKVTCQRIWIWGGGKELGPQMQEKQNHDTYLGEKLDGCILVLRLFLKSVFDRFSKDKSRRTNNVLRRGSRLLRSPGN